MSTLVDKHALVPGKRLLCSLCSVLWSVELPGIGTTSLLNDNCNKMLWES